MVLANFRPAGVNRLRWTVKTWGAWSMDNCFLASTNFLHCSHLYLFWPRSSSGLVRRSNEFSRVADWATGTDKSRKESNVSELFLHAWQWIRERKRPPNTRCIIVFSLSEGFAFLCNYKEKINEIKNLVALGKRKNIQCSGGMIGKTACLHSIQ